MPIKLTEISNFSSLPFFVFLTIACVLFWSTPQRHKPLVLLILSYLFYASYHLLHVVLLLGTTLIDFSFGKIIHQKRLDKRSYFPFVALCLTCNLGILFYFKYSDFLIPDFLNLSYRSIFIPLGLSFFTLQSIGYILDIARGKITPEENFITYALFVSFFPQIIAGPIEKAMDIIPQYKKSFQKSEIPWGLIFNLFTYGFFKKYVVADNIAYVLGAIPIYPETYLWLKHLTLVFFFIRIYCDFSGYTNMARAIALLFTISLRENFHFPLFAESPQDFWERWHMSLGAWIKSYFYTPVLLLFSNPYMAILIVFPMMGLWHGANINFLFWGLAWAVFIIAFKLLRLKRLLQVKWLNIFIMFNISSLLMVFYKVKHIEELRAYFSPHFTLALSSDLSYLSPIAILPLFVIMYEAWLFIKNDSYLLMKKSFFINVIFYLAISVLYFMFSQVDSQQVFYLQF